MLCHVIGQKGAKKGANLVHESKQKLESQDFGMSEGAFILWSTPQRNTKRKIARYIWAATIYINVKNWTSYGHVHASTANQRGRNLIRVMRERRQKCTLPLGVFTHIITWASMPYI